MGGKIGLSESDGCPHGFGATGSEPVEPAVFDFGDEAMAAEFGDQARGTVGSAFGIRGIVGGMGHLGVTPEIGDAFGHRTPPRLLVASLGW